MKKCPFCAEEIQDEAIKCKHCMEMLNIEPAGESSKVKLPPAKVQGKTKVVKSWGPGNPESPSLQLTSCKAACPHCSREYTWDSESWNLIRGSSPVTCTYCKKSCTVSDDKEYLVLRITSEPPPAEDATSATQQEYKDAVLAETQLHDLPLGVSQLMKRFGCFLGCCVLFVFFYWLFNPEVDNANSAAADSYRIHTNAAAHARSLGDKDKAAEEDLKAAHAWDR